ncbi:MAG: hypothetical protein MHMPM18_000018 [Marteilia pararefringens]
MSLLIEKGWPFAELFDTTLGTVKGHLAEANTVEDLYKILVNQTRVVDLVYKLLSTHGNIYRNAIFRLIGILITASICICCSFSRPQVQIPRDSLFRIADLLISMPIALTYLQWIILRPTSTSLNIKLSETMKMGKTFCSML